MGAGRPASGAAGVSHAARPEHVSRHPVHATLRVVRGIGNLRSKPLLKVLRRAFFDSASKDGFRLIHFSLQHDHVHLLVEAKDKASLSSGMAGLQIRIARRLNAVLGRRGRLFADRYHARALTTPAEVRNALRYVCLNGRKHALARGQRFAPDLVDYYSSAIYFDGWSAPVRLSASFADDLVPVDRPTTWLLRVGWRRAGGPISSSDVPGELS